MEGVSFCSPDGIRTRATALRGRRPRPLDDGARNFVLLWKLSKHSFQKFGVKIGRTSAGVPGLEPRMAVPETAVLPITPYPNGRSRTAELLGSAARLGPKKRLPATAGIYQIVWSEAVFAPFSARERRSSRRCRPAQSAAGTAKRRVRAVPSIRRAAADVRARDGHPHRSERLTWLEAQFVHESGLEGLFQ